ncbi:MAG: hypothetical protein IJE19_10625 [Clostridia bacterium]|nr:hypothetical protein [Clostridia bacterium]
MKRNPKRVIAVIMCILIAVSAMIFNNAFAADGVSKIDSYASLVENYGTEIDDEGRTDGFVYIGTEFYEEDGKLTDYLVKPGDKLTVKLYLKSNMYSSDCNIISFFDNTFFDVKVVDDDAPLDENGYTSDHRSAVRNTNHPMVIRNGITHTVTSINLLRVGWIKNICGFTEEYLASTDLVQNSSNINISKSDAPYEMTSDEWIFSYYVHVKDGLAEGTKGIVDSPEVLWQSSINPDSGKHDSRKRATVPVRHITENVESASDFTQMAFMFDDGAIDHLIIDDLYHEFTIEDEKEITEPTFVPDEPTDAPTNVYPDEPMTNEPTDPVVPTEPTTSPLIPDVTDSAVKINIKTPSETEIKYGDCITLCADVQNLPENAEIVWDSDNSNFVFSYSLDRKTCTIYPKENGRTVFTVKVIDSHGNIICEDEQTMTSKASLLWKIIGFFKQLFGMNRIIEQAIKF